MFKNGKLAKIYRAAVINIENPAGRGGYSSIRRKTINLCTHIDMRASVANASPIVAYFYQTYSDVRFTALHGRLLSSKAPEGSSLH